MFKKILAFFTSRKTPKQPTIKFQAPGEEESSLSFASMRFTFKNPSWKSVLLALAFMAMIVMVIYLLRRSPG